MNGKLIFLAFIVGNLAQEIAKQKCQEYTALAKAQNNALQCGTFSDPQSGVMAEPKEFPSIGFVGYERKKNEIFYPNEVTIISDDTLLTVGQCNLQKEYGTPKLVRLGSTHSTPAVDVQVKEVFCHPQFNLIGYLPNHDISIVKLKDKLNSTFIPACLDTEGVADGAEGIGVGRPIGVPYRKLLEKSPIKAWLVVKPSQECLDTFPGQNMTADSIICVRDLANGPGDCMGGPMYVSREQCVHTVVGLSSFGNVCSDTSLGSRTPSVYTKVAHYIEWIEKHTWPQTTAA